ncbi:hypothetical protein AMTRI_Chr05g65220 [Amborella trichopoda]
MAVYGPCTSTIKPLLWYELDYVASLPHPIWCLGGDFNTTRWSFERNSSSCLSQGMVDSSNFISKNELLNIPLQDNKFTWSSHSSQPILSKLDRFLLSLHWEEFFPDSHALTLPKPTSDHCPKPFRFELAWMEELSLSTLIPSWWTSFSAQVSGGAGFRLQLKLQLLKAALKSWSKTVLGNYNLIKNDLLKKIEVLDCLEEHRPLSSPEADLRTQSKLDFLYTLKKEEIYWYQRSRVNWLKTGDHDSRFFHKIANCSRRDNSISSIKVNDRLLE